MVSIEILIWIGQISAMRFFKGITLKERRGEHCNMQDFEASLRHFNTDTPMGPNAEVEPAPTWRRDWGRKRIE